MMPINLMGNIQYHDQFRDGAHSAMIPIKYKVSQVIMPYAITGFRHLWYLGHISHMPPQAIILNGHHRIVCPMPYRVHKSMVPIPRLGTIGDYALWPHVASQAIILHGHHKRVCPIPYRVHKSMVPIPRLGTIDQYVLCHIGYMSLWYLSHDPIIGDYALSEHPIWHHW